MNRCIPFLALLCLFPAFGQNEARPPGVPAPAIDVGKDVNPNQILREDQIFANLTGEDLADLYTRYTGRRVTVSAAASTAEFRFVQKAPLTYGQAAQLLKKAALLEGFVFVPDVNMRGHDVLVIATGGANPRGEGLEIIIDSADLPQDDRIVSYVMNLKFIKPDEIVRTFTAVVGQFGPYGSITPINNAGAVIITEKTSLIRRLIELKEEIDVSSSVATRFIEVKYADVQELADTLNEILNSNQSGERSAGLQRVGNNQPAPAQPNLPAGIPGANPAVATGAQGSSGAAEEIPLQIIPDTRTNRIFAMGRPVDIVFLEGLVAEFDTQTDQRNFLRRKLKFVAVADFLNIAETALERTFSGDADGSSSGGGRSTGANFGGSNRNTRGGNARTNQFGGGGTSQFGGGRGGGGGLGGAGGGALEDPTIDSAPEARLVGRTLLVADNITNSLLVQGPPVSVEIISNLLDEIDVKADQVMISAVFGQLSLGNNFNLGIEYLQELTSDGRFAGRGGAGADDGGFGNVLPLNGTAFDPGSLAAGTGLGLYGSIGDNFNIILNALQSDTNFKVLSRPTIFTANNRRGTISAGQRIAIPTGTFQSGNTGGLSTNINFQDVFLTLEVVPLVNSKDEITLEISLINEEVGQDRRIDNNLVVPDILSRQILTTVTVPNGGTVALGGLITSTLRESVSGIPVLSQIPGLGRLFSSTSKVEDRQELMVFIQPTIISNTHQLHTYQTDFDSRYDISQEAHDIANGPHANPGEYPRAIPVENTQSNDRSLRRHFGRPGTSKSRR